jgi:hypothetical protein
MYRPNVLFSLKNPFHRCGGTIYDLVSVRLTKGDLGKVYDATTNQHHPINPHWVFEVQFFAGAGKGFGSNFFIAKNCLDPRTPLTENKRKRWQWGFARWFDNLPFSDGIAERANQ